MPKITALSPINHSGEKYAPGDTLTVSESDAKYLINLGAAKAGEGKKSDDKKAEAEAKAAAEADEAEAAAKATT